jgi:transposase
MKQRKYTKEFRAEACKMVLEQGHKVPLVAQDLGLAESVLYKWVKDYKASLVPGAQEAKDNARLIKELEAKVRRLEMEREILKKAMAYFVEPSK